MMEWFRKQEKEQNLKFYAPTTSKNYELKIKIKQEMAFYRNKSSKFQLKSLSREQKITN